MNHTETALPSISGIALIESDEQAITADILRERAYTEILRQRAVELGLLPDHGRSAWVAPDSETQSIIDQMLEREVPTPESDLEEQQRYYAANRQKYLVNQALHARHILFAVTSGVDVQALAGRAEGILLDLIANRQDATRFAVAASKYSNCPSAQDGGDLGWITAQDCAPELARALFLDASGMLPVGLHPRLMHSRFGLHIVEVLEVKPGTQLTFEQVRDRVAMTLQLQSRCTALRQYMMLLAADFDIRGVDLETADSPLVQG